MSAVVNALPGVPDVESPLLENIFKSKNVPFETLQVIRKLREDGFAVIDFPEPDFEQLADTISRTLDPKYDWNAWRKGEVALCASATEAASIAPYYGSWTRLS